MDRFAYHYYSSCFEKYPHDSQLNFSWLLILDLSNGWMDGVARLEDGSPQVPKTTCYQDNVLFIVMMQGSAATALSPSDLSIIQPAHEGTASEWAASLSASPVLG